MRRPTRTVRSSLEERDTLLSSLSLELWRHEKDEGHEWQDAGLFMYSTTDQTQMSEQSVPHTATDPAGCYTAVVVIAVPLRIKIMSEKPFLCRPFVHLQVELLHTSLSLCLCFFFFFDFLCECDDEPLEWETGRENTKGENTPSGQIYPCHKIRLSYAQHTLNRVKNHTVTLLLLLLLIGKPKQHTPHTCTMDIYTVVYVNMHIYDKFGSNTDWAKYPGSRTPMSVTSTQNFSTLHSKEEIKCNILSHNRA